MRRALLTTAGDRPLTVGQAPVGTSGVATAVRAWTDAQANKAGTITSVQAQCAASSGQVAFFTIDTNHVVRAISTTLTGVAGLNTYTVSLAVQPGDRLGIWQPTNRQAQVSLVPGGGNHYTDANTTKPVAGETLAATLVTTSRLGMLGTP